MQSVTLLSRAKLNSGDHLITYSTKGLLEFFNFNINQIIPAGWSRLSKDQIEMLNESDYTVVPGGPCIQNNFNPNMYPLGDTNNKIIIFGSGLNGNVKEKFNEKTVSFLKKCTIYTRGKNTKELLDFNNINSTFSGCSVWFNSGNVVTKFNHNQDIKNIIFSLSRNTTTQELSLLSKVNEHFKGINITCIFNHGYEPSSNKAKNYAENLGIEHISTESCPLKLIGAHKSSDFHIGTRVHSHLLSLSLGIKSILLPIDIRGIEQSRSINSSQHDFSKLSPSNFEEKINNAINNDFSHITETINLKFNELKNDPLFNTS